MPKLKLMNVSQLKQLLLENNLSTEGQKAELVSRLQDALQSDEAQLPTIPPNNFQEQLYGLKKTMEEVVTMCRNLSVNTVPVTSVPAPAPVSRETTNNASTTSDTNPATILDIPLMQQSNETGVTLISPSNETDNSRYRYSVKEIAELIPEFNPTDECSLSVEQFIEAVERAKDAFNWNDKCILLAVYSRFKGAARSWLDASPNLLTTWCDFSTALQNEFGSVLNEAEISSKMQKAVRKDNEKVSEYCFRMGALGRRYQLSEAAVVRYAREGLKHRELQTALAATRFLTLKEFRESCETYFQNAMAERSLRAKGVETSKNASKDEQKPGTKGDLQHKRSVVCYNCNEVGHFSSHCPKPPRRKRCSDCQKVHPRGEPENCGRRGSVKKVKAEKSSDMFKKSVRILGQVYSAYLDTGSECHMIRQAVARAVGVHPKPCNVKLSGLWGGNCMAKEIICVPVEIDGITFELTLYVVGDDTLPTDMLLGCELFITPGVSTTIDQGVLKFSKAITVMKTDHKFLKTEK